MVLYECEVKNASVMYTMMGFCKQSGVNVEGWLTYFLDHVHEYDTDKYSATLTRNHFYPKH